MSDFIVLGSGPSAAQYLGIALQCPDVQVAAVNGSYAMLEDTPDVYGLFERKAVQYYAGRALILAKTGTKVFMHDKYGRFGYAPGLDYVPVEDDYPLVQSGTKLTDLFGDVKTGKVFGLGLGSATFMLSIVLSQFKPDNVYMVGVDGYAPQAIYAPKVDVYRGFEPPGQPICDRSNEVASRVICNLTNKFTDTKVTWYGKPLHPNQDLWNVDYIEEANHVEV